MTPASNGTYTTTAFAALAGVTPRALRYYDRLGLLRPRRSAAGYRIYSERDLETLEEIVALTFIGVPLKEIPAVRRHAPRSFAEVLHAQRQALENKRDAIARAIAAVGAAEASLQTGTPLDAQVFRQIIEVMHMDSRHEDTIATYTATLKAKTSHLSGMPAEQRAALGQQWAELVEEVKAALAENPAAPRAQGLLDRWDSLLGTLTGAGSIAALASEPNTAGMTPELREEIWARRREWLPLDVARETDGVTADEALAHVRERAGSFVGTEVLDFIRRARAARG